ncbi:hypothetical protein [Variovorax gossypii]
MIVFHFGPLSKSELTIDFDEEGAVSFFQKISALLDGIDGVEHVACFHFVRGNLEEATIELRLGSPDCLQLKKHSLNLEMSREASEYALSQLSDFQGVGYFFPAEFWSFSRAGQKYDTQVFFRKLSFTVPAPLPPAG